jgi:uncharacterized protein (DUF433 family)
MLSYSYPGTVKFFDHTATREEILDDYSYLEDADISAALVYAAKYLDHTVMHVA